MCEGTADTIQTDIYDIVNEKVVKTNEEVVETGAAVRTTTGKQGQTTRNLRCFCQVQPSLDRCQFRNSTQKKIKNNDS